MKMELSLTDNSWIYPRLTVSTLMFIIVTLLTIISPASQLILSSSSTVFLCPSEQLVLTCTSNVSFLQWRITDTQGISDTRTVAYDITNYPALTVGTTEFRFSLSSQPSVLPHISQVQADRVTNGTMISCSVSIQGNVQDTQSTTICIIGSGCGLGRMIPPELYVSAEQFELTGVVIIIEWTRENGVSYNVSTFPVVPVAFLGNTSVRVIIPYDIQFMVNISAMLCGEITTTMKNLFYGTCEHPLLYQSLRSFLYIMDYSEPAVVGTTVSFNCSQPGKVLIGPSTATCMEDGQWVPDPSQLQMNCKADCGPPPSPRNGHIVPYNSTLEGAEVMYICWNVHQEENTYQCVEIFTTAICNSKGKWEPDSDDMCSILSERSFEALSREGKIAVASSVTVFAITSISFFIVGFLSRHFCCRERKMAGAATPTEQAQIPLYDDVVLKQQKEQELELKENVAYAQPVLSQ